MSAQPESTAFVYENPFREIYELKAVAAWAASAGLAGVIALFGTFPPEVFGTLALLCAGMAGIRGVGGRRLMVRQRHLEGSKLTFMTRAQLREKIANRKQRGESEAVFLGYGFIWGQNEAQLTHTINRQDPNRLTPPIEEQMGQAWLHGIGMEHEHEVWLPIDHTAGHTLLVGTTRAGKSRTLDSIIAQSVIRGEACIIWDPKGDRDLRECAQKACEEAGRHSDFVYFHPAFPEHSARIDPLANFSRATELATRIASLIPSETGSDPFTAHSQMVLTNLCEGLLMINAKPTISLLKRYVSNGPEALVVKAAEAYFEKAMGQGWHKEATPYIERAKNRSDREMAIAYIAFYREEVQASKPCPPIEGLFSDFEHDKAHQAKMTASLTPVLTMLTSGPLGDLLSPNIHADDDRPITDFARIIRNKQVCYIGLDSLSDNMVGSALGSMFVSDMTAVSGSRYNYSDLSKVDPVNLIIDEAAELVSDKMIQLLNKAGGAKIRLVVATQTFADFAARVGSADKARQILGNLNNVIALRTIDGATQEYLCEAMPNTYVRHLEYSQATDTNNDDLFKFGYRISESVKETEVPLVTPPMFGCLPNLESFARISGGRVVKCRVPIIQG
jgi:conjugal transfer pilus assembly protein TraD